MANVNPFQFCWNELMTRDIDKAKKFYTSLLGWGAEEVNMGPAGIYVLFKQGQENVGGMMKMEGADFANVPPHWMSYVNVPDVDEYTRKAVSLGGKELNPPTDIPNIGRFSVIQDPTGAVISLYKNAH